MGRYERVSTLMKSNRAVEDWGKLLGDSAAVSAHARSLAPSWTSLNATLAAGEPKWTCLTWRQMAKTTLSRALAVGRFWGDYRGYFHSL